jgi:subtilisin family serine protease
MAPRDYILSRKASISLQTMGRAAHNLLSRVPAAALSAGLTIPAAVAAGSSVNAAEERARVLVETRNDEVTGNELTRIRAKRVKQVAEGFISAEIPVADAEKIYSRDEVRKVSSLKTKRLLDRALVDGKVLKSADRLVGQTGSGVFVAIIDSGFDLNHPMFRDSTAGLRVHALLDQTDNDREYTKQQLETAWANGQTPGGDTNGHGTHVASIAAGSLYQNWASGVAPGARLLLIKTDYLDLAGGASWAFRIAKSTPCVVNISLGHHFGSHDGTDQEERALERLGQPGRIIVVAAGNERTDNIHIGFRFSPGQSEEAVFDILRPRDNSPPSATLTIWYYKADRFDFTLTTPTGRRLAVPGLDRSSNELDGAIRIDLSRQRYDFNNLVQVQVSISFPSLPLLDRALRGWKVTATCQGASNGRLDGWFNNSGYAEFRAGSMLETARTVGMPATGNGVVAVASHVSKNNWMSDLGGQSDNSAVVGRSSAFSSRGPTRDNRNKPEISAPGQYTTAALAANSKLASVPQRDETARSLVTIEGTSMATPFVTGVVALMLEQNPQLTVDQLRTTLSRNAVKDQHTSELDWTPEYGFGKISASALIPQDGVQPAQPTTVVATAPATPATQPAKRASRQKQPSGPRVVKRKKTTRRKS